MALFHGRGFRLPWCRLRAMKNRLFAFRIASRIIPVRRRGGLTTGFFMNELIERPTSAEQLAAVISGSGSVRVTAKLKPVLARLPECQLAELDVLAKLAGKSRSSMVVHLLDVAFEEVRRASAPDMRARLDAETFQALQAIQSDDAAESEEV
jgi:hypothetical protein